MHAVIRDEGSASIHLLNKTCTRYQYLHSTTDLDRELLGIDREEKKLIKEIKEAARNGNEKGARVLAKSLVRLRGQRTKVLASSAQLRGVRASIGVRHHTCPDCLQYRPAVQTSSISGMLVAYLWLCTWPRLSCIILMASHGS